MKTSLWMPGARQELDMRYCVTLEPEELGWPLRFYFLRSDAGKWEHVGFEMGIGPVPRSTEVVDDSAIITASAVRWVQENLFRYRALAESRLNTERVVPRADDNSPEALAYLAAQYRELGGQRGAVNYLAEIHHVSRTTIWRRLKRAGIQPTG